MFASGGIWLFPMLHYAPMIEAAEPTNGRKEPTNFQEYGVFSPQVLWSFKQKLKR